MTGRERSGILWAGDLALRLSILAALAALVLLYCVGCGTPTPVPTAAASSTRTLSGWARETWPQVEIIGDASQTMADLFGDAKDGDATWTALIADQVVRIREADTALRGIAPPEECREAHAMLLSASGDYLLGGEYALRGVQQQDPYVELQGAKYTMSGAAKMRRFQLMVEAMTP